MASSSTASTSASAPQQPTLLQDDDVDWLFEIDPEYAGLNDIGFSSMFPKRVTKYDFKDDEFMNRPGISLDRHTDHEIAKLGQKVIPMVSSGFTRQGAAATLVLAYHLRSPPGTHYSDYVFKDGHKYATTEDTKYTDCEDERVMIVQVQGSARPISSPISDSVKEQAAMYSYIAASMLRLFTKPAATYMRAWNRIIEGFAKSYRKSVSQYTRVLPTPNEESMKSLAIWFSWEPKAKVTLFRLLHMSNSDKAHIGMKNFLYDMHLSYTGLHIVPMLFQLCELLNCGPDVVLAAIEDREAEPKVTCLKHILELRADGDGGGEKHKRKMWRYGRLFDVEFMADLQTKACPRLVYIFGEALKSEAPEAHSGILNIARLAYLSEECKERWAAEAQALLQILKEASFRPNKKQMSITLCACSLSRGQIAVHQEQD